MTSFSTGSRKILEMVESGVISVDEADRLLNSVHPPAAMTDDLHTPKFLRLVVEPKTETQSSRKIDIRVPLGLLRSGVEIARSLPGDKTGPMTIALGTHTLALDLTGGDPQNVDDFIAQFKDLTTDIDKNDETLRLFCE